MWIDLGPVEQFTRQPLSHARIETAKLIVTYVNGEFGVLSGTCNHAGGPLADGRLDGEYVVCLWHSWKFTAEPDSGSLASRRMPCHATSARWRTAGCSLRRSPSRSARKHAASLGAETQTIHLSQLTFRACEGYYSKSAHACTWPCSITQMDPSDQMDRVYEAVVHWAHAIVLATPIRWGAASSLYYKMVERLNCVQNQVTIANTVLLRNKVAAFIITGGQDNVQGVAGKLLGFFSEIGCQFPQFPYIAHSLGWTAEDMERNVDVVKHSEELREGARALATRAVDMAQVLLDPERASHTFERGGRKAHRLAMEEIEGGPAGSLP